MHGMCVSIQTSYTVHDDWRTDLASSPIRQIGLKISYILLLFLVCVCVCVCVLRHRAEGDGQVSAETPERGL